MKRLLIAMLACLLLCGCGAPASESTTAPIQSQEAVAPTEPAGSYAPGSEIEVATSGAVRAYPQNMTEITGLTAVGDDLLVFSGNEKTTITRLTGENLFRVAEVQLDMQISPKAPGLYVSRDWVIYFDESGRELVYLDEDLREFHRLQLPEDILGEPILNEDRTQLYYSTASGVRCLDIESGISRLIKEMTFARQSMADILLDGTVLAVNVSDENGNGETLYLDAATGSLMYSLMEDMHLTSAAEYYYAINTEGTVNQMIFGKAGEEPTQLTPRNYLDSGVFLETVHAAVVSTENGLDYYDLASGTRSATLTLGEINAGSLTTSGNGFVYFLDDGTIYRWDLSATPAADKAVYTGIRYTWENPDSDGLAQCRAYALLLSQRHGLDIQIVTEAVNMQPSDYNLVPEYQVPVIMDALTRLEKLLDAFPEGFFETSMAGFTDGKLTLCLVRDLVGSYESGSLERVNGIHFWEGEHACVALAMGETLEENFYHQIFHVLESRVLSETIRYYRWDELNPKGFAYDNDYTANLNRDGSEYLEEKSRSFIDTFSMSFAKEDRARVMEYACMEGNENYFISYTMQQKLRTICEGIREAYGLEDSTEVFLWEQYLESPLAP